MARSWFRRFGALGFVLLIVAVSGGCSGGCSGCGTALTDGFPIASDTENGASIRVTSQGLGFINANLPTIAGKLVGGADGGGVLAFPIPDTPEDITVGTATICGGTPSATQCVADIDLAHMNLPITFSAPHDVKINGTIPIKVADLPIALSTAGFTVCTVDMGIGSNPSCNGNTPVVDYLDLPLTVDISIATDQTAGQVRTGYSAITISSLTVSLTSSDIKACGGGACGSAFNDLTFLVTFLQSTLEGEVKTQLENELCVKASDTDAGAGVDSGVAACPTGSNDVSGICRYGTASTDACVSTLIGLDGHEDLSSLLASISPGAQGAFDFALAAGGPTVRADGSGQTNGDLNPIDGGMTLGMVGGSLPKPQSSCVPAFTNTVPTGVPVPDEMMGNALTPWPAGDTGPDLGIALAGRFLDYMFGGLYNAGTLCLGISTDNFSQLQSGLLSVLIPSIKNLTFEQKAAAAAVTTRPQKPPTVKIGGGTDIKTDPLLTISMQQFAIDFYVWSDDRFVRAMTYTADLSIPVNLSTHVDATTNPNGGLLPVLGTIGVANASVTNAELLTDDPTTTAAALTSLLGGIAGQLLGSIKPIDLSSALSSYGIAIKIPDGAIRKLTKGTDDFVGIFADFSTVTAPATRMADVQATIVSKKIFPEAMSLTTANPAKNPILHVTLSSSFQDPTYEFSWSIDHGTRSAWSPLRDFTIQNDSLFLQGKHVLNVWARLHGQDASETVLPTQVPFIIDVLPPNVDLTTRDDGSVAVSAWDIVSETSALQMRYRVNVANAPAAEWTAWSAVANVDANTLSNASSLDVQVRDEEENVGSVSSALIRGRADSTLTAAGAGCGSCSVGTSRDSTWSFAMVLGGLALVFVRRRRNRP
jgi:MYXO-CTERM domain-containing protein